MAKLQVGDEVQINADAEGIGHLYPMRFKAFRDARITGRIRAIADDSHDPHPVEVDFATNHLNPECLTFWWDELAPPAPAPADAANEPARERLAAIAARVEAVTPGRRFLEQNPDVPSRRDIHADYPYTIENNGETFRSSDWVIIAEAVRKNDAECFVHAPDDLRYLLAALASERKRADTLLAENVRLREALEVISQNNTDNYRETAYAALTSKQD